MPSIDRFVNAQRGKRSYPSYNSAYQEIEAGQKQGHWIWYIFPQLKLLGVSSVSQEFGIVDFNEACDYLKNKMLFENYQKMTRLVLEKLKRIPIDTLMNGSVDSRKLVSSLTLFREATSFLMQQGNVTLDYAGLRQDCDHILSIVSKKYKPCKKTTELIEPFLAPIKPVAIAKPLVHRLENLSHELETYIEKRNNEWSFHYNFLGIMSFVYWLQDKCLGTDHFNDKSKAIKIQAAMHLKQMIDSREDDSEALSKAEAMALEQGRLGEIVRPYGSLETIKKIIQDERPSLGP